MVYTFFVCVLVYFFTYLFACKAKICKRNNNNNQYRYYLILSVFIYSIIIGLRYNVGLDYEAYHNLVIGYNLFELDRVEFFPHYLAILVQSFKIPFYVWFVIMAGISIFFVEIVFRNKLIILLPFSVLLYLLYYLDFNVNVVRQACAASIVLFSFTFIKSKEKVKFLVAVGAAYLFHKSSLIVIPLYWLISDKDFFSMKWQFVAYLSFTLFGTLFIKLLIDKTTNLWIALGYMDQLETVVAKDMLAQSTSGYGIIMNFIRYSIFILLYPKVNLYFKDKGFNVFYKIFFIGICLYVTTMSDIMLSRMNMYFLIADVAVSSYMYYYMFNMKKYKLLGVGLLAVQFIMAFQAQVINIGEWQFVDF